MNTVSVTYYGMDGTGKNVTAAKLDAGAKLERLVKDVEQGPQFGEIRGIPCLVFPTLHGWGYQWMAADDTPARRSLQRVRGTSGTYPTREEAEGWLRYHLAQLHVLDDDWADWLDELMSDRQREDLQRYRRWQEHYREYRAMGKSDHEAHQLACHAA